MNILTNTQNDYKRWEDKKLGSFTQNINDLTVEIRNPNIVSKPEKSVKTKYMNLEGHGK